MEVSGIAAAATEMSQAKIADAVQMAVLKKAMDIQAAGAVQLIQGASKVISTNPPHLGNQIDISV